MNTHALKSLTCYWFYIIYYIYIGILDGENKTYLDIISRRRRDLRINYLYYIIAVCPDRKTRAHKRIT